MSAFFFTNLMISNSMVKLTKFPKILILSLKASPICLTISPRLGAGTYKKKAKKIICLSPVFQNPACFP